MLTALGKPLHLLGARNNQFLFVTDRRRDEEKQEAERKKKLEHDRLAEIENEKRIRPRPPGLRVFPEIPFAYYTEKSFKLVS